MRVIKWEPFRDVDDVFDRFIAESLRCEKMRALYSVDYRFGAETFFVV